MKPVKSTILTNMDRLEIKKIDELNSDQRIMKWLNHYDASPIILNRRSAFLKVATNKRRK